MKIIELYVINFYVLFVSDSMQHFITSWFFHGKEMLVHLPTSKVEVHPLSTVRNCLFSIFAAPFRMWRPCPSATRHAPCRGDRDPHNALLLKKVSAPCSWLEPTSFPSLNVTVRG